MSYEVIGYGIIQAYILLNLDCKIQRREKIQVQEVSSAENCIWISTNTPSPRARVNKRIMSCKGQFVC